MTKRKAVLASGAALLALLAAVLGGGQSTAQAGPPQDAVLDWNTHTIEALFNAPTAAVPGAGQTPPVGTTHIAMVHGAVYDAVNMIVKSHEPYLENLPSAPSTASKAAAVATAAHHVLVGMVVVPPLSPAIVQRLDALYTSSLAAIPDGKAKTDGVAAGAAAAKAMLDARADDGRYGSFAFTVGDEAGEWRPTPPANLNDPFAWVARVEPFVLNSTSQFRSKGPHALTSGAYTREYNEVKELGGNGTTTASARTAEQLAVARFFVVNPVEMYNRAFRTLSSDQGLTLAEEARLFATVNLAGADGLINCWDDKAHWSFWRPITAIQLGNDDGNDRTAGDSGWTPFIASPPYPDHTSGYNCVTGSFMHGAKAFFGKDKMEFDLTATINVGTPPVPTAVTRDYDRFTDVVDDTIDARVYQGIHFRAADVQGAGIGKRVARWLDRNYLNRVKKSK